MIFIPAMFGSVQQASACIPSGSARADWRCSGGRRTAGGRSPRRSAGSARRRRRRGGGSRSARRRRPRRPRPPPRAGPAGSASPVVVAPTWTMTGIRPADALTTHSARAMRSSVVSDTHWPVEPPTYRPPSPWRANRSVSASTASSASVPSAVKGVSKAGQMPPRHRRLHGMLLGLPTDGGPSSPTRRRDATPHAVRFRPPRSRSGPTGCCGCSPRRTRRRPGRRRRGAGPCSGSRISGRSAPRRPRPGRTSPARRPSRSAASARLTHSSPSMRARSAQRPGLSSRRYRQRTLPVAERQELRRLPPQAVLAGRAEGPAVGREGIPVGQAAPRAPRRRPRRRRGAGRRARSRSTAPSR